MDFSAFAAFDAAVASGLRAVASPPVTRVLWVATLAGDTSVMTAFVVAAVVLLWTAGRRRPAVVLATLMGADPVIAEALKACFGRPRPPVTAAMIGMPGDASFPSGHALASALCYGLLALFAVIGPGRPGRKAAAVAGAVAGALLVGASRVYLGVHWASDVVGSWVVAAGLLWIAYGALRLWSRRAGTEVARAETERRRRMLAALTGAFAITFVVVALYQSGVDPLL